PPARLHRPHQPGAVCPSFAGAHRRARADRARAQAAGRAHFRHRRHRIRAAHEHGAVREHGRRETCSRSLPRRRARAHRRHRRATVAESGLPDYEATTWFGLFATAGTPRPIVTKINAEVAKILADPQFREKFLAPQMFEPMASSPEEFADYIRAQRRKWAKVIGEQKLSIEK